MLPRSPLTLRIVAALIVLLGAALLAGGVWLAVIGGSLFYLLAGLAMIGTGVLLVLRRPEALALYAALLLGTLVWSLWEVGFDWWPLAARGGLVFALGFVLLLPPVRGALGRRTVADALDGRRVSPPLASGFGGALVGSLAVALAVAGTSWFTDLHRVEGHLPGVRQAPGEAGDFPAGEWHAYGRTQMGQRYSPLAQITPENVADLEEVWRFETGDEPQPGDPEETTFQVTPLKIGERLFLCTPHQSVIALDATTGAEAWRYDPRIQGELALQHLTCRGLSYAPPGTVETVASGTPAAAPAPEAPATGVPTGTASELSRQGGLTAPQDSESAGEAEGTPPAEGAPTGADPGLPVAARNDGEAVQCGAGILFMPTADGRVIGLDPDTGSVCANMGGGDGQIDLWDRMPNVNPGSYYSTSPVIVAGDRIIVGGTVLDNVSTQEASGVIRAFDIASGELLWNWDSGNPDETAPIAEGETYTPNSPNSWSIMTADEALGMVYVPLGNQPPDQWGANRSPQVEEYSSSVVALDIATGEIRWHFQTVHHDLWDYDVPAQASLMDFRVDGETIPILVQPTKQGEVFVLDRRNGQPALPVRERLAPQGAVEPDRTAPTQPVSAVSFNPPALRERDMWGATLLDQLACRIAFHGYRYDGRFTPPSPEGSIVYPGNFGVFNWGSVAVDPARGVMFATPTYLAFVSTLVPRPDDRTLVVNETEPEGALPSLNENFGAPYAVRLHPFLSPLGLPCQAPPWGYVAGVDLATGDLAWMHKNGTTRDASPVPLPFRMGVPNLGGPMMTAGGVAFLSGTIDYYVRGYDVTTGEELWRSRLPAGGQATPMSFEGSDGRQYVVVVAGGHGSLGTKRGDSVIAYALPQGG